MSSSSLPIRRQLVLRNIADDELDRKIFAHITSRLFNNFSEVCSNSVKSIVLQTNAEFNFDPIDFQSIQVENNLISSRDKFLQLTSLIENQSNLNRSLLLTFLNILLNLDGLPNTSASIEQLIKEKFGSFVEIQIEPEFLVADPQTQTLIDSLESISEKKSSTKTKVFDIIKNNPVSFGFLITVLVFICGAIMFRNELIALLQAGLVLSVAGVDNSTELSTTVPNTKSTLLTDINLPEKTNSVLSSDIPTKQTNATLIHSSPAILQLPQLIGSRNASPKILPKYRVNAKSYKEYITGMANLPFGHHEVIVSIVLQNSLDWPSERNINLPNSSEINKLLIDGPIAVDNLIDILSQTVNIQLLQIRNTGDKLCKRNQGQLNLVKGINKKVYLPLLKSVVLQYFTSCTEVYETLATYIEPLRELRSMVFHKSVIDDNNHVFIKKLLENNADFLKELKFAHTNISVSNPFLEEDGKLLILQKVETLRLDSMSKDQEGAKIPIGKSLSKIFPNLRVLYSNYGYVEWSQFPNILQCKNLTKLGMGIRVPERRTFFDVSFFRKYLPYVTGAHISLKFDTCKTADNGGLRKNEIDGWENVKYPLAEVVIRSNCKIHAIMANTANSLQSYKVQEYKSDNGQYTFTYKNI